MAPLSPQAHRDETVWHYMQGGPGIFKGDMHFYKVDGGLTDDDLDHINVTDCPLYFLSGEYDYSGTPADTRVLADRLGVDVIVMEQMGHFPMSENPERFLDYLRPVLEEIASGSS
jgi:pimeloyl-ACP methyl ester carboxylesterase